MHQPCDTYQSTLARRRMRSRPSSARMSAAGKLAVLTVPAPPPSSHARGFFGVAGSGARSSPYTNAKAALRAPAGSVACCHQHMLLHSQLVGS